MSVKEKISLMSGNASAYALFVEHYVKGNLTTKVETPAISHCNLPSIAMSPAFTGIAEERATELPAVSARGGSWDIATEAELGEMLAKEARACKLNTLYGVSGNVMIHPESPQAAYCYGEDPYFVGEMASAITTGIQKHNVMAVAGSLLHISPQKSGNSFAISYDEKTLEEVYLPQFKRLVDHKIAALQTSVGSKQQEHSDLQVIQNTLQGCGFSGIVITSSAVSSPQQALEAGITMETPRAKTLGKKLLKAIRSGDISEEQLDTAVLRMVSTILRYIAKEDRFTYDTSTVGSEEHTQVQLRAAEKSLIILKNEGVFPLDTKQVKQITCIAPASLQATAPLEALKTLLPKHIKTHHIKKYTGRAISTAAKSDATLLFINPSDNAEQPAFIKKLAQQQPYLGVVIMGQVPSHIEEWHAQVPAILVSGASAKVYGLAIARTIVGLCNPGGKLPYTVISKQATQQKEIQGHLSLALPYYYGYTLLDRYHIEPVYHFGHGLSYTTFAIGKPTTIFMGDAVMVEVTLTNSGEFAGDEVVQVYVAKPDSAVDRPKKLLRGFQRVSLLPGESTTVAIVVQVQDLRYYDSEQKTWVLEPGDYSFLVGNSSNQDCLQEAVVTIE